MVGVACSGASASGDDPAASPSNAPIPDAATLTAYDPALPLDLNEESPVRTGLVYLHGSETDRDDFLDEAVAMARGGAAAIVVDAPFSRTGTSRKAFLLNFGLAEREPRHDGPDARRPAPRVRRSARAR